MSLLDPGASQWGSQHPGGASAAATSRQSVYAQSMMGGGIGGGAQMHSPGDPNYQPSIAPSERSNVGMPTRYRPVSTLPPASVSGDNTLSAARASTSSLQNWTNQHAGATTVKSVNERSPVRRGTTAAADKDDDDEDEGWEEMKKKREKKRSTWKMKKGDSGNGGLKDIFFHA
jgi:hypothetical protein